jgi:hypothetical protein
MTGPRASYGLVMAITKCLIGVPFGEVVLGLPSLHSPFTSSPTMRSLNTTRRLVAKLRGAHERKRRETGNCEGRKSHAEENPELVALVRQLRRRRPKGGQQSLREISAELAARGLKNERGNAFSAASISLMLA